MTDLNGELFMLISAPYSGATLVSMLFTQHDQISSDGEIFFPGRQRTTKCTCSKIQDECPYYTHLFSELLNSKGFDLDYFYYIPRYFKFYYLSRFFEGFWLNQTMHRLRNLIIRNSKYLRKINETFISHHIRAINRSFGYHNTTVYFDGAKWFRRVELFSELGYKPSIIHLIRDPRGFCCSYIKNNHLNKDRNSIDQAIAAWNHHAQKTKILESRTDSKILRVVYEDLCREPEVQIERICDFMNLNYKNGWKPFSMDEVHVTGNRMRFKFNGVVKEDKKWIAQFSSEQAAYILDKTHYYSDFFKLDLS